MFCTKVEHPKMVLPGWAEGFLKVYKEDLLWDYIIQVEEQEIKVHKVVLAAFSDYFRAMFSGSFKESKMDLYVLEGLTPQTVSRLIELIYTGDEEILSAHAAELLECAIYLQMTSIVKLCTKKLTENLTEENCLIILSKFVENALDDDLEAVKRFIVRRFRNVLEKCPYKEVSIHVVRYIISMWAWDELALFEFVITWITFDYDNRKLHVNELMSQIRFCLMSPGDLATVREMNTFPECGGTCYDLLDRATEYHKKSMYLKVIDNSDQTNPRCKELPRVFNIGDVVSDPAIHLYPPGKRRLWDSKIWYTEPMPHAPKLGQVINVIEVNDFLITCTGSNQNQMWHIFDARTKAWENMARMQTPKDRFALVYHDKHLFALGGELEQRQHPDEATDGVEQYSFETNEWQSVNALPAAAKYLSACGLGDAIYVSGGRRKRIATNADEEPYSASADLDCLLPQNGSWERKAPMSVPMEGHTMQAMKMNNTDIIVSINLDLKALYYNPQSNVWTLLKINQSFLLGDRQLHYASIVTGRGNTVYFLNINGTVQNRCDNRGNNIPAQYSGGLCVEWQLPDTRDVVEETLLTLYPINEPSGQRASHINDFAAVLKIGKKRPDEVQNLGPHECGHSALFEDFDDSHQIGVVLVSSTDYVQL